MKETFYFSHDYNAQSDEKILELRMNLGREGYGIYWALIERLASNKGKLDLNKINSIAFDMRVDKVVISNLLDSYNLFTIDEEKGIFYNDRLLQHFEKRDEGKKRQSEGGRKAMAKRWGEDKVVISTLEKSDKVGISSYNKIKENKIKENKIKENIVIKKEVATKVAAPLKTLMIENINKDTIISEYNSTDENIKKEMMEFYLYWSEKKPNGKKERWEMEKTFDVSRRFNKWLSNSNKWNKGKPEKYENHQNIESVFG